MLNTRELTLTPPEVRGKPFTFLIHKALLNSDTPSVRSPHSRFTRDRATPGGGASSPSDHCVPAGQAIPAPDSSPSANGAFFGGWYIMKKTSVSIAAPCSHMCSALVGVCG
eukprot:6479141-Amphidinium_carterae.3